MKKVTIIGAGIAGLSAAYKLRNAGVSYEVFEKNDKPGGLLKSFSIDGFRFDHAVHLSFATEPEVRAIFDKTDYYVHSPESKCFDEGVWIRHPVQNNLYPLPTERKVELIKGFIERPNLEIKNYADWLNYQYGYKLAEQYPIRYTLKYWDCTAESLGVDWVGNRMHRATLDEVLAGAMTDAVPNYYYAKEMRYPKTGGYISFLSPLIEAVDVSTGKNLTQVNIESKTLSFEDGEVRSFENLINTSPLPIFFAKIKNPPIHLLEAAERLQWTKVHLVSFGFNKPDLIKELWCYIYDEDIYASRIYSPSAKSPDNCPYGSSSLQFEIYENNRSGTNYSENELVDNCLYALKKMGIATADDVCVQDVRTVEYGNVVFYKGMEADRGMIRDWLKLHGVISAGRFGAWDYLWSNQAMVSGFHAADQFL